MPTKPRRHSKNNLFCQAYKCIMEKRCPKYGIIKGMKIYALKSFANHSSIKNTLSVLFTWNLKT